MHDLQFWLINHWPVISACVYAIASEVLGESRFEANSVAGLIWSAVRAKTKSSAQDYINKP